MSRALRSTINAGFAGPTASAKVRPFPATRLRQGLAQRQRIGPVRITSAKSRFFFSSRPTSCPLNPSQEHAFVDATGAANLASVAGLPCRTGDDAGYLQARFASVAASGPCRSTERGTSRHSRNTTGRVQMQRVILSTFPLRALAFCAGSPRPCTVSCMPFRSLAQHMSRTPHERPRRNDVRNMFARGKCTADCRIPTISARFPCNPSSSSHVSAIPWTDRDSVPPGDSATGRCQSAGTSGGFRF